MRWLPLFLLLPLTSCREKDPWAGDPNVPEQISFNQHIRPLLTRDCLSCHSENNTQGGLRLDLSSGVASVTVQNSPKKSLLWEKIIANHPTTLPERDQAILWRWIKQGTPTEGHWASLPISKPSSSQLPPSLSQTEPVSEEEFIFLAHTLFGRKPTPAELTYNQNHQPTRANLIESMLQQKSFTTYFKTRLLLLSGTNSAPSKGPFAPYLRWLDNEVSNPDFALDNFFRESLAGDLIPEAGQQGAIATAWTRLPHRSGIQSLSERVAKSLLAIDLNNPVSSDTLWPSASETLPHFLPDFPPASKGEIATPPFLPLHTPQQLKGLQKAEEAEPAAWELAESIPDSATVAFAQWLAQEETAVSIPDLSAAFSFDEANPLDLSPLPIALLKAPITLAEGIQGTALAPPAEFEGLPLSSDRAFTLSFFLKLSHLPTAETSLFTATSQQGAPTGFRLNIAPDNLTIALLHGSAANSLIAKAQLLPQPGEWHHLTIGYDGSRKAAGFSFWIDAQPVPLTSLNDQLYGIAHSPAGKLSYRYPSLPDVGPTLIDELQIYQSLLSEIEISHLQDGKALLTAVREEFPREDLLFNYYLRSKSEEARTNKKRAIATSNEVSTLQDSALLVPIAAKTTLPTIRPTLPFYSLKLDSNPDRLGLATWLLDDRNPITPRVIASKLYQMIHGVSLLPSEDISNPWDTPTDAALLDYLSQNLLTQEWNLRSILTTILLHPPTKVPVESI